MRVLSGSEVEKIMKEGKKLPDVKVTAILDEFQNEQPGIYQAIFGEFSDCIATENEDMANLFMDLCFDMILIYRIAFGKPPVIPNAEEWIVNSMELLDTELKATSEEYDMDVKFRQKLQNRFENRVLKIGFQIAVLDYLYARVEKYASLRKDRESAIGITINMVFVIMRLMDELYEQRK